MVEQILGPLMVLVASACLIGGAALGIVSFILVLRARRERAEERRLLESLRGRIARLEDQLGKAQAVPEEAVPLPAAPPVLAEEAAPAQPAAPLLAEEAGPKEQAPPTVPAGWARVEEVVGRRWMTWAGALALFLAAGFFVKLAIDYGWIGPTARVVLGIALGIVLLALGERSVRGRMRAFGQGLIGGGLAILYVSLFASFSLYHLVPQSVAFAAMILVTAGGVTLAVLHDAVAISFLAMIGGLLTPVLLSTRVDARDALFSYLTLLDLGVLAVAFFRRWRALDALAFAGTAALFAGWYERFYAPAAMVPVLLWLAVFYAIFLLTPFIYHLRHRTNVTLERFVMALANATWAFGYSYAVLHREHRHVLGFVALGMAACYLVLGAQSRRRIAADMRAAFGFLALAVLFLTLAVPLHMKLHGITLVWALEGPVLLYLAYRYGYLPVRIGAFIVVLLSVVRLFAVHWPLHEALFVPVWNRHFGAAICVPLSAAALAVIHQWQRKDSAAPDRALKLVSALGAGLLALVVLHAELGQWFDYSRHLYLGRCALPVLWAAGGMAFLWAGLKARSVHTSYAGLLPLAVAAVLAAAGYEENVPGGYVLFLNARFAAGLAAALAIFAYAFAMRGSRAAGGNTASALWAAGALVLLALLSTEAYNYCHEQVLDRQKARWLALMSLSVVWAVYAAAVLAIGFWRRILAVRLAALGLFGVTAMKVVLVDISGVHQIYRVISFFVLGLLMVGAAYLYHRVEKRFAAWLGTKP
jgi:uncharacterized membrane protein